MSAGMLGQLKLKRLCGAILAAGFRAEVEAHELEVFADQHPVGPALDRRLKTLRFSERRGLIRARDWTSRSVKMVAQCVCRGAKCPTMPNWRSSDSVASCSLVRCGALEHGWPTRPAGVRAG